MAEQLVAIVDLSTGHSPHDAGSQFLRANVAARQRLAIRSVPVFEVAHEAKAGTGRQAPNRRDGQPVRTPTRHDT